MKDKLRVVVEKMRSSNIYLIVVLEGEVDKRQYLKK